RGGAAGAVVGDRGADRDRVAGGGQQQVGVVGRRQAQGRVDGQAGGADQGELVAGARRGEARRQDARVEDGVDPAQLDVAAGARRGQRQGAALQVEVDGGLERGGLLQHVGDGDLRVAADGPGRRQAEVRRLQDGRVHAVVADVAAGGRDADEVGGPQVGQGDVAGHGQAEGVGQAAARGAEDRPGAEDDGAADAVAVRVGVQDDGAAGQDLGVNAQDDVGGAVDVVEV